MASTRWMTAQAAAAPWLLAAFSSSLREAAPRRAGRRPVAFSLEPAGRAEELADGAVALRRLAGRQRRRLCVSGYLGSWLFQFVLILFILLFLLMQGRRPMRRVTEVFGPSQEIRGKVSETLGEMTEAVARDLIWRTVINIGLAIVIGGNLPGNGPAPGLDLGPGQRASSHIPDIGPIIAGIPPLLDAFVHCSPLHALGVLVIYTVVITLEGYLVVPL